MIYKGQVPYKKSNGYVICKCDRCGDLVTANERDARELASIFHWQIKKNNLWITKIRHNLVHALGGEI